MLELKHVYQTFTLDTGTKLKALSDVNLTVSAGEVLVLLGPSGSGKSTCLRVLAGLQAPTSGSVLLRGAPLDGPNPETALVFQSSALLPWKNVADNVALGVRSLRLSPKDEAARVKRAIDLVGLEGFEEAYPKELSGGMKQRVGLARALVMERPILCLDEPFSSLDILTAETLRKEVLRLWMSKQTPVQSVVMITHRIEEAVSMGSRILVMSGSGMISFTIKNDLPYPRVEKSSAFKNLVDNIHDLLTEAIIPDTPEWVPPALAASTVEGIPAVPLTEVVGIVEMVSSEGGRVDTYALSQKLMKDSVQVLILAKAAELLDFVDTPRNQIVLTDQGRELARADINGRKRIVHRQMKQLKLTQLFHQKLSESADQSLLRDEALQAIQDWLPSENPESVLDTLLQWGRYGELFGYNDDTQQVYIDLEGSRENREA